MRDVSGRSSAYRYDRRHLLSLCTLGLQPGQAVLDRVRCLGIHAGCPLRRTRRGVQYRRYRSRRRLSPGLIPVNNGAAIVAGNRPAARSIARRLPR
jgi:hypothetical protein